jgi:hypothetical protein
MSSAPTKALRKRLRREITLSVALFLLLLFCAQFLPVGKWLRFVAEHESSQLDEMIFVFVALCLVFPVSFIVRWRDLSREVVAHAQAVEQLEESAHLNAQLSQMTNLLHACLSLEEATPIIDHYARHLFPGSAGALLQGKSTRTCDGIHRSRHVSKPW